LLPPANHFAPQELLLPAVPLLPLPLVSPFVQYSVRSFPIQLDLVAALLLPFQPFSF